jgi:hypothetical protein
MALPRPIQVASLASRHEQSTVRAAFFLPASQKACLSADPATRTAVENLQKPPAAGSPFVKGIAAAVP